LKKQTWIVFLIFVVITWFLVTTDNMQFVRMADHVYGEEIVYQTINENLLDQFEEPEMLAALSVIFFFPFLLMIEATFFPKIRKGWWRILFLIQALALGYGTLIVLFFMVFKLFTNLQEQPGVLFYHCYFFMVFKLFSAFYFIVLYLHLGVLWNLLLILPDTKKLKWIQKSFEMMSFRKSNSNV
jgi:hypothetical protein